MFTRKSSAIIGILLVLLSLFGNAENAHATETASPAAAIPSNICDLFPICPIYR